MLYKASQRSTTTKKLKEQNFAPPYAFTVLQTLSASITVISVNKKFLLTLQES
jgi:hypothetical protein